MRPLLIDPPFATAMPTPEVAFPAITLTGFAVAGPVASGNHWLPNLPRSRREHLHDVLACRPGREWSSQPLAAGTASVVPRPRNAGEPARGDASTQALLVLVHAALV